LQYYKKYRKKGKIVEPDEVMACTREYQRKNDVYADFCESYVALEPGSILTVANLFERFKEYCAVDNIRNKANKTAFQEAMCSRYGRVVQHKTGKCWKGIRINERTLQMVNDEEGAEIQDDED